MNLSHSTPALHLRKMTSSDHEDSVVDVTALSIIAQPLAGKKLHKKILKMVKKGNTRKGS
jgi:hypothetical protein